jgi:hypothetical protein
VAWRRSRATLRISTIKEGKWMRHDDERQVGTLSYVLGFQDFEKSQKEGISFSFFFFFFFFFLLFGGKF